MLCFFSFAHNDESPSLWDTLGSDNTSDALHAFDPKRLESPSCLIFLVIHAPHAPPHRLHTQYTTHIPIVLKHFILLINEVDIFFGIFVLSQHTSQTKHYYHHCGSFFIYIYLSFMNLDELEENFQINILQYLCLILKFALYLISVHFLFG